MTSLAPAADRDIEAFLRLRLAQLLALAPDEIDAARAFDDYGLSSMDAVALTGDLEDHLGRPVDAEIVYAHPSIRRLCEALSGAEQGR